MDDFRKAILELSMACSLEQITSSRMVTAKPCYIFLAIPSPQEGSDEAEIFLYNGETDSASQLIDLSFRYAPPVYCPSLPAYFNKGLYVKIGAGGQAVTIQYLTGGLKKS